MKPAHWTAALLLLVGWLATARPAHAADAPLDFLHTLQARGYGDTAVEYLQWLERTGEVPSELRDVWDLEMSKSYRTAADNPFDAKDRERLLNESQRYMEKFLREKPDHPEAVTAMASWGTFLVRKPLQQIDQAKALQGKNKAEAQSLLADARAELAAARESIQKAADRFEKRLAALPAARPAAGKTGGRPAGSDLREQIDVNWHETQLQLALIDYYVAQTYLEPDSPGRIAGLEKAARAFNDVFQYRRTQPSLTGLLAHMYEGKVREELGDWQTALDIFDEVLANDPKGLEDLFAQVEHTRLKILAKRNPQGFLDEASEWLKTNARSKNTESYQAIALDVAQTLIARSEKASAAEKPKLLAEAMKLLVDMAQTPGPYRAEAIRLRQSLREKGGAAKADPASAGTFEEAVALGDACMAEGKWTKAAEWFQHAAELAEKRPVKDQAALEELPEKINNARLMLAQDLYGDGKFKECIEACGPLIRDAKGNVKKESRAAAKAASMSIHAAMSLYQAAGPSDKPAALKRVVQLAEFTEQSWPDWPEGDDGRMARAQALLIEGETDKALALYERVNPKSDRYPPAMYYAGMNYWRLCLLERAKPEDARDNARADAYRAKAIERLEAGLSVLRRQVIPGQALPRFFLESQVLLAEIRAEGGEIQEAAALYQPLVDALKAEKPQTLDQTTLRVFLGAVRAYSALNQLDKAGEVGSVLVDLGPDTPQVNAVLIEFAKLLNLERKKAVAVLTELETTTKDREISAAKARVASIEDLLAKITLQLAGRKDLPLPAMMFLGETLNVIGRSAEARDQFQKILDRAKTDPEFAQSAQKAMARIRRELLRVLRERGQYEEAMKQVTQLIKEYPNALEPLMEKGEILEAWANKDPAKFDEAVAHWAMVRNRLQSLAKKPDEYYEVNYKVAQCLVREAQRSRDKSAAAAKANQAEQVLKAPMILNPKLNGPDTVEKYKALLKKAVELQGRTYDAKTR